MQAIGQGSVLLGALIAGFFPLAIAVPPASILYFALLPSRIRSVKTLREEYVD